MSGLGKVLFFGQDKYIILGQEFKIENVFILITYKVCIRVSNKYIIGMCSSRSTSSISLPEQRCDVL